ncbi:MAG: primosomal protein N' [Alphaproteobacteria bacterium]|nr:primosomal protein N' [Alphaproteobacteria bacterium]
MISPSDDPIAAAPPRVRVLLPLPLAGPYDYRIDDGLVVAPGDFVRVPLGRRVVVGVVWDDAPPADEAISADKLKAIIAREDAPPMTEVARRFIDRVAHYTMSAPGAVLRMAMSVPGALEPEAPRWGWMLGANAPNPLVPEPGAAKLTPGRRRVLEAMADGAARTTRDIATLAGVGAAIVKSMAELGWLVPAALPAVARREPDGALEGPSLSYAQNEAAKALVARLGEGFSATLVDGVTGAGKTEVYFEAIAAALRAGRQVLVLLPEIAMSAQWLARFERRFGATPASWHSELNQGQRMRTWREVAAGRSRVVVGARSALFLPFRDLGLIVVDEEHEQAFKQEDGVIYHARDMAVLRAHLGRIAIALVSATPSLETVVNVSRGRYRAVHLPARHGGAALPSVELIDLRRELPPPRAWIGQRLRAAVGETLAASEQAVLFLNRRGYAPLTLCRACGHRLQCPHCSAWLVEHRLASRLQCHHCGYTTRLPRTCTSCGAEDRFAPCGPGVERVAEEARALFPQARVEIITSDTIVGPGAATAFVERMTAGAIDLLIGTQIVAKGHHFPGLTLVGVVDADLGLAGGDPRAGERTYQLLHQVAGRAGRADKPGRVLLQTHLPEHPAMQALAAGDRDGFLAGEVETRERLGLPPFGRLAALIVAGPDADEIDRICRELARRAPSGDDVSVLGPAPAPLALLRGRHRRRFLLRAARDVPVQAIIAAWLAGVKTSARVRIQIDIDPYSFL